MRQARRPVNVFAVVSHCRNITALLSALKIPVEFPLVLDMMFCLVKERTVAMKLFITTWLIITTKHVAPTHNTLLLYVSKWYEGEAVTDSRRTWCPCSVHMFKGENIILQSCHHLALQRSQTLSIKNSWSVHWMLYCNLNNDPFKTEIMHQLNEHDKACHVVCKQLLNLLQKIQAGHTECIPDVRWDTFPSNKLYIQTIFSILGSKQPLQTVNILSIA